MNEMMKAGEAKNSITSLELLDQINMFRKEEANSTEKSRTKKEHRSLLGIIRDELDVEIDLKFLFQIYYKDSYGRSQPMFELTISQAKRVLLRESKFVRREVIKKLEALEDIVIEISSDTKLLGNMNADELAYVAKIKRAEEIAHTEIRNLALENTQKNETIEVMRPKTEIYDTIIREDSYLTINEIAKVLNLKPHTLFDRLRESEFLIKQKLNWNKPKQVYIDNGKFAVKYDAAKSTPDVLIRESFAFELYPAIRQSSELF